MFGQGTFKEIDFVLPFDDQYLGLLDLHFPPLLMRELTSYFKVFLKDGLVSFITAGGALYAVHPPVDAEEAEHLRFVPERIKG